MIDAATAQALAAFGALLLVQIALIGTWIRWEVGKVRDEIKGLRQDLLIVLQGHTHDEEGEAVFHRLTASAD